MEVTDSDRTLNLAYYDMSIIRAVKSIIFRVTGDNTIKLFTAVMSKCLSLASLPSLALCLWVRPGAYPRVEHLKSLAYYKNP